MLVTVHFFGVESSRVPAAVLRMGLDRRHLARTSGLLFWKLLGTGSGTTFTLRDGDPRRWGLLAVWARPEALADFERASPTAVGWGRIAAERWRAELVCLRSRGTWAGQTPFVPEPTAAATGPVAAITRARLRPARMRSFWSAVPPVAVDAAGAPGLCYSVGIGEAPIGLQGTFSLWSSAQALSDFAYRGAAHRAVIARTEPERWYAEELFARFTVQSAEGTIAGRDPLAH